LIRLTFSSDRLSLLTAILTAVRATAAKSPVPALEGLLIETVGNAVKITGYDLKTGIIAAVDAEISEPGSIVLNARLFAEIVRRLPDETVTIATGQNYQTKIDCGASTFEIIGSPASDYPELPGVDAQSSVEISGKALKSMIVQTNFAVSDNESRPVYTGALFEIEGNTATIVAVDGFRLALRREALEHAAAAAYVFIVPGTALSEVEKIISGEEENVSITVGAKHIMFSIGATVLISRRLEGEFLNYKNSIPKSGKYSIQISRREFVDAVERVSLIISDKVKSPVRCVFGDNAVQLTSISAFGRASDECAASGDGENLEIGFNNKYLLDALKAAPADNVEIQLTSAVSPCVILPTDGDTAFLYMILPVRLSRAEGEAAT
jgi:DNA polymerase-3 subunit beta